MKNLFIILLATASAQALTLTPCQRYVIEHWLNKCNNTAWAVAASDNCSIDPNNRAKTTNEAWAYLVLKTNVVTQDVAEAEFADAKAAAEAWMVQ